MLHRFHNNVHPTDRFIRTFLTGADPRREAISDVVWFRATDKNLLYTHRARNQSISEVSKLRCPCQRGADDKARTPVELGCSSIIHFSATIYFNTYRNVCKHNKLAWSFVTVGGRG